MMDVELREEDLKVARQISREARADPTSRYAGKYVGILDGQVVVIADSPEEGLRQLRQIEPDRARGILFEAGADHETTQYVWPV